MNEAVEAIGIHLEATRLERDRCLAIVDKECLQFLKEETAKNEDVINDLLVVITKEIKKRIKDRIKTELPLDI